MANQELTPWSRGGLAPFGRDPFASFRREMDRLFDDFFAPAPEGRSFSTATAALSPSIEIDETDKAYIVKAEVPGLAENEIELNLQDNALTLSGEKRSERDEEKEGRRYSERTYGRFSRTIPFPTEVDADKVEAACQNGVLTITLPKNPQARDKSRRIEIKSQAGNGGGQAATPPAE